MRDFFCDVLIPPELPANFERLSMFFLGPFMFYFGIFAFFRISCVGEKEGPGNGKIKLDICVLIIFLSLDLPISWRFTFGCCPGAAIQ